MECWARHRLCDRESLGTLLCSVILARIRVVNDWLAVPACTFPDLRPMFDAVANSPSNLDRCLL
jgi:hypothetical protein